MNYQQTVDYLFSQLPMYQRTGTAAYKADLSNSHELDRYFNYPHRSYRTIHVAGTNGKGSVSHMLASVLQHAGYKTGLHTSPHLFDFRERIKVDGQMVPRSYVIDFVEKHRAFFEKIHPSFFEMSVFMAFEYFAETHVDIAIIEVGLGGRLDSTNVITPLLSVITNIGLDHTEFLGNTLESIAGEKAGIIKKNVPVVIGESHEKTKDVFVRTAGQNKAPVYFADNEYTIDYSLLSADGKFQTLNVRHENEITYPELQTDLLGIYQKKNIVTALTAIDALKRQGIDIPAH